MEIAVLNDEVIFLYLSREFKRGNLRPSASLFYLKNFQKSLIEVLNYVCKGAYHFVPKELDREALLLANRNFRTCNFENDLSLNVLSYFTDDKAVPHLQFSDIYLNSSRDTKNRLERFMISCNNRYPEVVCDKFISILFDGEMPSKQDVDDNIVEILKLYYPNKTARISALCRILDFVNRKDVD